VFIVVINEVAGECVVCYLSDIVYVFVFDDEWKVCVLDEICEDYKHL
jgi:hypothetical protein